jgi:hypothetical protein
MAHVEGTPNYLPATNTNDFLGLIIIPRSGPSLAHPHATATAKVIYGPAGLAPGVKIVHCFNSNNWMGDAYLRIGSSEPPLQDVPRIFNHSWISDTPAAPEILRRVDYQIDQRNVIMCVGVNNGRDTGVPALLASAYNVIAVGDRFGLSSGGYTRVETPGRCKPDLVAPMTLTSFATPLVSACAARLLEAASNLPDASDRAAKPQLIKAVLLAGATKPPQWRQAEGKPLDEHFGAGMLQLDNSLMILQAGPTEPGPIQRRFSWDFRAMTPNQTTRYELKVSKPLGEMSIILTWHRRISGNVAFNETISRMVWDNTPRLADFDLRLTKVDDQSVTEIAASRSAIDNVEHIYLPALPPGRYVLEVARSSDGYDEPWDYALAWRIELLPPSADTPTLNDLVVNITANVLQPVFEKVFTN